MMVGSLSALAIAACTGPVATPEPQPVTAVGELARLRATGQLDSNRLECAMLATIAVVDEMRALLPELRRARNREAASAISAHARSVQSNQEQAEITAVVGAQEAMMREQAIRLQAAGHDLAALRTADAAHRMLEQVRGDRLVASSDDIIVPLLSDEDADRLAEYTRLRSEQAELPMDRAGAVSDRLRRIEREQAGIQETYAGIFLQVYQDPALRCTVAG